MAFSSQCQSSNVARPQLLHRDQFGITYSSVSHSVKSMKLKLEKDRQLKKNLIVSIHYSRRDTFFTICDILMISSRLKV